MSCGAESVAMSPGVCDCVCALCLFTARLICFSPHACARSMSSLRPLTEILSLHICLWLYVVLTPRAIAAHFGHLVSRHRSARRHELPSREIV